jgi:transposase, IS5 family
VPNDWKDKPAKLSQKARDARWTMKRGRVRRLENGGPKGPEIMVPAFSYKSQVSIDRRHGLIRKWAVTHAAANDGRQLPGLIDPDNTPSPPWGGYGLSLAPQRGPAGTLGPRLQDPFPQATGEDYAGTVGQRQCRAHQGPLSDRACFRPSERADALVCFTIGIARARTKIDIVNLAYNMRRFVRLERSPAPA